VVPVQEGASRFALTASSRAAHPAACIAQHTHSQYQRTVETAESLIFAP